MEYMNADGEIKDSSLLSKDFDDYLDTIYDEYPIAGVTVFPSAILRECDEIAYREVFNNWLDSAGWNERS